MIRSFSIIFLGLCEGKACAKRFATSLWLSWRSAGHRKGVLDRSTGLILS